MVVLGQAPPLGAYTNTCRSLVCYETCDLSTRGNKVIVEQVVTRHSLRPHSQSAFISLVTITVIYAYTLI